MPFSGNYGILITETEKEMVLMKKLLCMALCLALLSGCAAPAAPTTEPQANEVQITLSDGGVEFPADCGVHTANDIVYYEAGHDETYGEGDESEAHTPEEAAAHTVVHITQPGTYRISGKLSAGQIAVDLGEDAAGNHKKVVTLILDNADITCRVAPAVIFYNVYECGNPDDPQADVDTAPAGANVILAPGSINNIVGSHVAKIYKPETVIDGNTDDAKKLHKYDAAFYSRMSMNIGGEGCLNITADNEGLDSELHLTINGGEIYIESGNDGINTNEDGVSVTTINGGKLTIHVTGETGEGDGIDSNGWLVINGGEVRASACAISGDAGIDSDMGIQINGGTVCATGNMLDRIDEGGQTHAVFTFAQRQEPGTYTLKNAQGDVVIEYAASNAFQYLILSAPELTEGTYTLWSGDIQYEGISIPGGGFGLIQPIERPEFPGKGDDGRVEIPPQPTQPIVTHGTVQPPPGGDRPADMPVAQFPQGSEGQMPVPPMPPEGENMPMPQLPEGVEPSKDGFDRQPIQVVTGVCSTDFPVTEGANYFMNVRAVS